MKRRRINNHVLEICDENDDVTFSVSEELKGDAMYIYLAGQIKNEVAHEFEDELMAVLSVCKKIVISFEKVNYIAGMALKSLLSVQQMVDEIDGAAMILSGVSPEVMEILKASGFSEILQIETD